MTRLMIGVVTRPQLMAMRMLMPMLIPTMPMPMPMPMAQPAPMPEAPKEKPLTRLEKLRLQAKQAKEAEGKK